MTEVVRWRRTIQHGKRIVERALTTLVVRERTFKRKAAIDVVVIDTERSGHEGAVRLLTVPYEETRWMTPLDFRGKPYPPKRAARKFLAAGKRLGITSPAKRELREVTKEAT